jgi:hypothetical protein
MHSVVCSSSLFRWVHNPFPFLAGFPCSWESQSQRQHASYGCLFIHGTPLWSIEESTVLAGTLTTGTVSAAIQSSTHLFPVHNIFQNLWVLLLYLLEGSWKILLSFFFFVSFETGSYCTATAASPSSCLWLSSAGIMDVHHHAWCSWNSDGDSSKALCHTLCILLL